MHSYRYIPQLAYSIKRNVKGVWFDKLKSIFIRKTLMCQHYSYIKLF